MQIQNGSNRKSRSLWLSWKARRSLQSGTACHWLAVAVVQHGFLQPVFPIHETAGYKVSKQNCEKMRENYPKKGRRLKLTAGTRVQILPKHFCDSMHCYIHKKVLRARRCTYIFVILVTCLLTASHSLTSNLLRRYIEYHGINKLYAQYQKDVYAKNKGVCFVYLFFNI